MKNTYEAPSINKVVVSFSDQPSLAKSGMGGCKVTFK